MQALKLAKAIKKVLPLVNNVFGGHHVKAIPEELKNEEAIDYLKNNEYKFQKGDIIGNSGDTGGVSGPHLHFEIRDNSNRPINPLLTNYKIKDQYVWIVALFSVLLVLGIGNIDSNYLGGYKIGYELLPINGLITFIGLILIRRK